MSNLNVKKDKTDDYLIILKINKSKILKSILGCKHPNIEKSDLCISETKCIGLYCPDCFLEYAAYANQDFKETEKAWKEILSTDSVTILINEIE